LQTNQALTSLGCISATQPQPKEPWISLLDKFDGTCSKLGSFVNQVHWVIRLHHHQYPTSLIQLGFIKTLLLGTTLVWFTPLLEH
jgi:hypothetical protein